MPYRVWRDNIVRTLLLQWLFEGKSKQSVVSSNKRVCVCKSDQMKLNKPPMRLLKFAPTVTYRAQPCQIQQSSKCHVKSLKQQTNPKVENIRELPNRICSLSGFTPSARLPLTGRNDNYFTASIHFSPKVCGAGKATDKIGSNPLFTNAW